MIYLAAIFFYVTASPEAALKNAIVQAEAAHNPQLIDNAVLDLAQFLQEEGRYLEAEPLYRRSNSFNQSAYGPTSRPAALSLLRLGTIYHAELRFAQAEPLIRHAAELLQTLEGPDGLDYAYSIANLAAILADRGENARAEPVLRRAIYLLQKRGLSVTALEANLALIYLRQGEFRQAQALLETVLAGDPTQPATYAALAELAIAERRWADADTHIRQAVARLTGDHPSLVGILHLRALAAAHSGELPSAIADMKRSIELLESLAGTESPTLAIVLDDYAKMLRQAKRRTEARATLRRARAIRQTASSLTVH